jgi:REP element-mobilizing transposase RayT
VTFCCYHRRPLFNTPIPRQVFEAGLERVRLSFELCVYGYVVMPEHVHLLLNEPRQQTLADAIKSRLAHLYVFCKGGDGSGGWPTLTFVESKSY